MVGCGCDLNRSMQHPPLYSLEIRCCVDPLRPQPEGVICTQIRQRPLSPMMRTIRIDGNHRNAVDL